MSHRSFNETVDDVSFATVFSPAYLFRQYEQMIHTNINKTHILYMFCSNRSFSISP